MAEHPLFGPMADRLLTITRGTLDGVVDAEEALQRTIEMISLTNNEVVGVFGTLVNRLATAELQVSLLVMRGEEVDSELLGPIGDFTCEHFLGLVRQTAHLAAEEPRNPVTLQASVMEVMASYKNLEADPQWALPGLRLMPYRLVMHERLRGLDPSTVKN